MFNNTSYSLKQKKGSIQAMILLLVPLSVFSFQLAAWAKPQNLVNAPRGNNRYSLKTTSSKGWLDIDDVTDPNKTTTTYINGTFEVFMKPPKSGKSLGKHEFKAGDLVNKIELSRTESADLSGVFVEVP